MWLCFSLNMRDQSKGINYLVKWQSPYQSKLVPDIETKSKSKSSGRGLSVTFDVQWLGVQIRLSFHWSGTSSYRGVRAAVCLCPALCLFTCVILKSQSLCPFGNIMVSELDFLFNVQNLFPGR